MRERYFIPAAEMLHLYDPDRVNQTRGVTWVHSVMVPAHMLGAYEESEAVAARIGASKMGLFERRSDSLAGDLASDPKPATMEANPGTFEIVPDGYEFKAWEPDHPTGQFPAFIKQMLRKIASGFSVFYNVLANDAEGVSYSTMRSFALVERDDWRSIQQDFIDMWRRPLYAAWLGMALLTGSLKLGTRDPSRYMAVRHRPRGWQWIDPEKEAKAAVLSIQNGLGTRTGFLAEKGEDIEDVFAELAREKELAKEYGLSISGEPVAADEPAEDQPKDSEEPDEDKDEYQADDEDEESSQVATA
jgi:lambda family phage portal protein